MTYREGQTATNKSTGERFIYQGGGWKPLPAPAAPKAAPAAPMKGAAPAAPAAAPPSDGNIPMFGDVPPAPASGSQVVPEAAQAPAPPLGGGAITKAGTAATPDPVAAPTEAPKPLSMGKNLLAGAGEGAAALLGTPAALRDLTSTAAEAATGYFGADDDTKYATRAKLMNSPLDKAPGTEQIVNWLEGKVGPLPKPGDNWDRVARATGQMLPGMLTVPGGVASRFVKGAVGPGLGAEFGAAVAPEGYETPGRIAGAIAGGRAPGVARRAVTPVHADPAHIEMAKVLKGEGVPLTAGQHTGSESLRRFESRARDSLGAPRAIKDLEETQGRALTGAMVSKANVDPKMPATTANLQKAADDMGNMFDAKVGVPSKHRLPYDQPFLDQITDVEKSFGRAASGRAKQSGTVQQFLDDIRLGVSGKPMKGAQVMDMAGDRYQSLRGEIGEAARAAKSGAERDALFTLRNALDGAFERGLTAKGATDDLALWKKAREDYGNIKPLLKASKARGPNAARGILDPGDVRQAVGDPNSELATLAAAGESILKRPAPAAKGPGPVATLAGAGAGHYWGSGAQHGAQAAGTPIGGLEAMIGLLALPKAVDLAKHNPVTSRAYFNPVVQSYLKNQLLPGGPGGSQRTADLVRALIQGQQVEAPLE